MPYAAHHLAEEPTRAQVDQLSEPTVLEFGTPWCGHCQAAAPLIEQALGHRSKVAHIKVEDGKGRALGRSFQVKLWPTLVFLKHGKEVARLVRPASVGDLEKALHSLTG